MNILITSASRKVSLVKAFQRALREEGKGNVIAIDAVPRSAALFFADIAYTVESGTDTKYLKTILKICSTHDVKLIIPTRDEELPFFASHIEHFQKSGITIMVPTLQTVKICQDKYHFNQFCQNNDFEIPHTFNSVEQIKQSDYPLFIRGRIGKGSVNAIKINSKDELEATIRKLPDPVIQTYIKDDEFTVDLFSDFNGIVLTVVPRQRLSIYRGESIVSMTSKNWIIINECIRLAQTLKLIGHNTIQCFYHNDQVKFIEVNPRYGGGATLGFAAGAFTPQLLIKLVEGKQVHPKIGEFIDKYIMLRYSEDLFITEQEVNQFGFYH